MEIFPSRYYLFFLIMDKDRAARYPFAMTARRGSQHKRCPVCQFRQEVCLCQDISMVKTRTRISILMHFREQWLTSNTAKLGRMVIPDCDIYLRGRPGDTVPVEEILQKEGRPLYLFPYEDSLELGTEFIPEEGVTYHLIVPDGTWSQAQKIKKREPLLKDVPNVHLPKGEPSEYFLRISKREGALCTYEAMARAIAILEGHEQEEKLLAPFHMMVDRTLDGRGQKKGWDDGAQVRLLKDKLSRNREWDSGDLSESL